MKFDRAFFDATERTLDGFLFWSCFMAGVLVGYWPALVAGFLYRALVLAERWEKRSRVVLHEHHYHSGTMPQEYKHGSTR